MECPGRLRRKTATPVPMCVVRHSGCSTSATTLRQPQTSERMWRRREGISVWGSLDHQKYPTTRRKVSVDSLPSLSGMSSPKATTVESLGTMALGSGFTPCSWASPERGEDSAPGEWGAHLARAVGKGRPVFVREHSITGDGDRAGQWLIAAGAEAFGLGAALVAGVEGMRTGEEARTGGRAVPYRSVTTGRCVGHATHGTPLVIILDRADVGCQDLEC